MIGHPPYSTFADEAIITSAAAGIGATANVLAGDYLNLLQQPGTSQPLVSSGRRSSPRSPNIDVDYASPTDFDAASQLLSTPVLHAIWSIFLIMLKNWISVCTH
jgi:hypothetical protein